MWTRVLMGHTEGTEGEVIICLEIYKGMIYFGGKKDSRTCNK